MAKGQRQNITKEKKEKEERKKGRKRNGICVYCVIKSIIIYDIDIVMT